MATDGAVQIDIVINEKSITVDRNHAVSLKVTRLIGESANQFTLEVYDDTAYQVESALMDRRLATISVRYSVSNKDNKKSILFTGTCYNYELSFVGKATMLSITGILASSTGIENGYWFDTRAVEWVGGIDYYTDSDGNPVPYKVDGKSLKDAANFANNEDVCAFIDYPVTINDDGEKVVSSSPVVYYNPSRIFKRIIHAYNGDKLGSTITTTTTVYDSEKYDKDIKLLLGEYGEKAIETAKIVWNYLTKTNGYSIWVAASIMGNMIQESSMNPEAKNNVSGGHYGLCQWSKVYYPQMWGATLNQQLAFIDTWIRNEYNTFKNNYKDTKPTMTLNDWFNCKSTDIATTAFAVVMERAGSEELNLGKRKSFSRAVLSYFTGSQVVSDSQVYDTTIEGWGTGGNNGFILGEVADSRWVANMPVLQQPNETAAQYITNTLCKYAVSDTGVDYKDEVAGFQYLIKDGKHCFIPLDYGKEVSSANTIEVRYGMINSNVISFSIAKVGVLAMMGNNATKDQIADATSVDDFTTDAIREGGENIFGVDSSSEELEESAEYLNWYKGISKKSFKGVKISSSSTRARLSTSLSSYWSDLENYSFSAELTIWADASNKYVPGNYINILVSGGNGVKHYASGIYYITKVEDNISVDGYTQTLKLLKYPDIKHNYVSSNSNKESVSSNTEIHDSSGSIIGVAGTKVGNSTTAYHGGGGSSNGAGTSGSFGGRWSEEVALDNV